jgi:hypothetical protein
MKRLYQVVAVLCTLAFSAGAVYGLWWLAMRFVAFLGTFESEVAAALVATSGTVLIGLITILLTQRDSKLRETREAHRGEKVAIYKRFMESAVVDVMRRTANNVDLPEAEMVALYQEFFLTFTADMIVWASPSVIQAFRAFRTGSASGNANALLLMDNILREIRKDLGNSNWGIEQGDLISTFLRDPSELKALIGAPPSRA